jgi:hypothetical protein
MASACRLSQTGPVAYQRLKRPLQQSLDLDSVNWEDFTFSKTPYMC